VEILNFTNQFEEGKNAKRDIIQEIVDDTELSGLLNASLKALHELMKHGTFTASKKAEDKKSEYLLKSNPVLFFLQERYGLYTDSPSTKPDDLIIKKSDVYSEFVEFCKMNEIMEDTQNRFFRIANKYFNERGIESRRISYGSPEYYIGIYDKKELLELQITGKKDDTDKDTTS
jgi:hypothetical protein